MNTAIFNVILFLLGGFLAMYSVYRPVVNKSTQTLEPSLKFLPILYILPLYALGAVAAYFAADTTDFVEPLNWWRIFAPLGFAALIYASSLFFGGVVFYLCVAIAVGVTVWLQPLGIGAPFELPHVFVRLLVFAFALVFCLYSRIMNALPHTYVIPHILILVGMLILAFIGAMPLYVALCAAVLAGVLAAYLSLNYYDVAVPLDDGSCATVTYLLCALILMNLGEFCFPSCVIFTIIFWAELVVALANRLFISHSGYLSENTYYYLAAQRHTLPVLVSNIVKIGIVLLFIAWFQLFSVNQYSLMIVALCLTIWLNGILGKGGAEASSFKEINRAFVNDLKQNFNDAKKLFTKNKKDDE